MKHPLMPSEAAIARALEVKHGITRDDLLRCWFGWLRAKPADSFRAVDAAFLSFAARHEPTNDQRMRARAAASCRRSDGAFQPVRTVLARMKAGRSAP